MNAKLLLIILFFALPSALFSQATCSAPAQLTVCPDTTLLNQSNLLMGNDAPAIINIAGEDLVYQINVPVTTRKIYLSLLHLTGGGAKISLMRDSCDGTYLYTNTASSANTNFVINVSGATKYFLWIDAFPTIHFDLGVGADTLVTIINHPNTQGNWGFDTSGCAAPFFIAVKPFYQVQYNGVYQTDPMTLSPLNVSGTMCISTFLRNATGDEGVRTFSFAFGTGYNTITAPDTVPGFYNSGYWLRTSFLNTVTYTFFDSLSAGRGDFDGSPDTCLRYDFCFSLIPTSNSPSLTNVLIILTTDGFGAPYYGYSANGCCSSGYPTCHFGNGGSGGGVNAIGFGMNDPGNGNPLPIELVNFNALAEKDHINVSWITGSEINNDYFSIERSTNGTDWTLIQRVSGAGNSTGILHYQYVDQNPSNGISYYRLKQTDYDGIEKVYPPQEVKMEFGVNYRIYPNPASDYLYVESGEEIGFHVNCFNSMGQKMNTKEIDAGQTSILTISDFPNGIYFISLEQSGLIVKKEAVLVQH